MKHILYILFFVLTSSQAIETTLENDLQASLELYNRLNIIETVKQSKSFMINSTKKSIAYFDSFDNNAIFFISNNYEDYTSRKVERITGKFYPIEPNTTYYIRNHLWTNIAVLTKYFLPIFNEEEEIKINDNAEEINFIYLDANKIYTLNFEENKNKKMIKLSYKTLNSKVYIKINKENEAELNEHERYYEIKENFKGKIELEIKENNALIEFLTDTGDYAIFPETSIDKTEVDKDILIITVEKNPKNFQMILNSVENFNYSLSYGFSNNSHYYYYSKSNPKISSQFKEEKNYIGFGELMGSFSNKNMLQNEFISFAVVLERKPEQKIYLEYKQTCLIDKIYDEEMSEEICTKIINNLKDILEIYVYTDIAKNPPDIENYPNYHHKPIDLKAELDKVSKTNRKFYEFYQEIEKILTSTRDLHFNIYAHQTPKGIKFGQYFFALPFDFEIRKDKNDKYRIFIKKNRYFNYADISSQELINSHLDIPLKAINGIEPFEYIQNWSQYRQTKNPHAQFSSIIGTISSFFLHHYPVDYYELLNEYEFDDNNSFKMFYLNNLDLVNDNEKEFNNYFLKVFQNKKSPFDMPHYDIVRDNYLISKGLKQRKILLKEEKIKWDVYYENVDDGSMKYLKCRFDEKNKVNVLVQNSFNLNIENAYSKVLECFEIFYSNEYPIIIIENSNPGGYFELSVFMHQIMQLRLTDRSYESHRISDISKNYFNTRTWDFVDIETCKHGTFFNEIGEITDHYNYSGLNIEHKRTKVIDTYPRNMRNGLNNIREEYFNSSFLKRPTDIIIFTDSYSYSATSGFIKGFQSTGGAIVVGYYGNPIKNGTDFFDSSQSHSEVHNLEKTEMYKSLNEIGFIINGVTCGEYYDDFYQKENPIPREYTLEPVDYRVDIYTRYSDEIYETFIKEGLEVHNLFNNESYCNAKNDKLLLHDDKCYKIEKVSLPKTIRLIGNNCFRHCYRINNIVLGGGLKSIGDYAFSNCMSLRHVELPEGIKQIGEGAFKESGLLEIKVPESLREIKNDVFANSMLRSVSLPQRLRLIEDRAFSGLNMNKKIEIPADANVSKDAFENTDFEFGKKQIDWKSFLRNHQKQIIKESVKDNEVQVIMCDYNVILVIKGIAYQPRVIPLNSEEYGTMRMYGSSYEEIKGDVVIPDVIEIKDGLWKGEYFVTEVGSMKGCRTINKLRLPLTIEKPFEPEQFSNSSITSVNIPEKIVDIPNGLFKSCYKLQEVSLPSNLKSIGDNAFTRTLISSIIIPEGTMTIGKGAFSVNRKLVDVTLPSNIIIGSNCFYGTPYGNKIENKNVEKKETNIWDNPKYANDEEFKKYKKQLDIYFLDVNRFLENEKNLDLFPSDISYNKEFLRLYLQARDKFDADPWMRSFKESWSLYMQYTDNYLEDINKKNRKNMDMLP